jgi:hypothetical protein
MHEGHGEDTQDLPSGVAGLPPRLGLVGGDRASSVENAGN